MSKGLDIFRKLSDGGVLRLASALSLEAAAQHIILVASEPRLVSRHEAGHMS